MEKEWHLILAKAYFAGAHREQLLMFWSQAACISIETIV